MVLDGATVTCYGVRAGTCQEWTRIVPPPLRYMTLADFPRHPLTFGPSQLTARAPDQDLGGAELWAKREDCNSGLAYGGNKTRKLEYLVADALARGADTLVSIGGVQSNHTRQVAAAAARLGMKCVLVQESWVDFADVVYDRVGNIQCSRLMGADVRLVEAGLESASRRAGSRRSPTSRPSAAGRMRSRPAPGPRPAALASPAGRRRSPSRARPGDRVRHDRRLVTGSTQHGRRLRAARTQRRVLGIDASARPAETLEQVTRIARPTAELIGLDLQLATTSRSLDERYHAGTYAIPDDELEAIRLAAVSRACSPTRSTREVDGGHDRPRLARRDRAAARPSSTRTWGPAGAQRLRRAVSRRARPRAPRGSASCSSRASPTTTPVSANARRRRPPPARSVTSTSAARPAAVPLPLTRHNTLSSASPRRRRSATARSTSTSLIRHIQESCSHNAPPYHHPHSLLTLPKHFLAAASNAAPAASSRIDSSIPFSRDLLRDWLARAKYGGCQSAENVLRDHAARARGAAGRAARSAARRVVASAGGAMAGARPNFAASASRRSGCATLRSSPVRPTSPKHATGAFARRRARFRARRSRRPVRRPGRRRARRRARRRPR